MTARPFSSDPIASTPQDEAQGRSYSTMAVYGQAWMQRPHLMHFSWSMKERPSTKLIAFFGQTCMQGCARHPRQLFVTQTVLVGQRSQANGMTLISSGS